MNNSYQSLFNELARNNLLISLCKSRAEEEFVSNYKFDQRDYFASDEEAITTFKSEFGIDSDEQMNEFKLNRAFSSNSLFLNYAHHLNKRKLIIEDLLKGQGESLFLRFKDNLDRVLFSMIRVDSFEQANDLYYSIEADEIEFGDASKEFSTGPESKTQGIVGPIDLTTPHPDIVARLRTAKPKQLFKPFELNNTYTIIRLDYRFDSEYNDKAKKFLGNLIFNSQFKNSSVRIYKELIESNNK